MVQYVAAEFSNCDMGGAVRDAKDRFGRENPPKRTDLQLFSGICSLFVPKYRDET
ncbi:hypothetical protein [Tateyamaria sp.]|uniref:hypothetical protein n=1 Tax=Tateyamaria sp. TaxID=1929288 RepID=UPI003B21CC9B